MNVFTAIGIATFVIIIACIIMNNYFHSKYAVLVSQGQSDVIAGQRVVTEAVADVKTAAAMVKAAQASAAAEPKTA